MDGSLKNPISEAKSFGIKKISFILDRGFYSEDNIKELSKEQIDFILSLPFSVNIDKGLIIETNRKINNPTNVRRHGGDIIYASKSNNHTGGVDAYGYYCHQPGEFGMKCFRITEIETKSKRNSMN